MNKKQNKRIKQLKKLEILCVDELNGYTPKLLIAIIYSFCILLITCVVGCIIFDPKNNIAFFSVSIIYQFLVGHAVAFILLGWWFILTKCDFDDFNFDKAKKILDNYEPANKKKYDYFINNFNENSEFFWEYLNKFIEIEKQVTSKL